MGFFLAPTPIGCEGNMTTRWAIFFSIFISEERDIGAWISFPLVFIQAAQSALGFEKETEMKDRTKVITVTVQIERQLVPQQWERNLKII